MTDIIIAIDAMGGDYGMEITVPAALSFLRAVPHSKIILVGIQQQLNDYVRSLGGTDNLNTQTLEIVHASQSVGMNDHPSQALKKKDSSMRVALNLVKQQTAHAIVSAGNTGALVANSRFVLKMIKGLDRPAICTRLPTKKEGEVVHMLDLGANIDCSSYQLLQFAIMGSVLHSCGRNPTPKISLLNVGEEDIKGSEKVKNAASLLKKSGLNYIGYVEGDEIHSGNFDVIVCDGFEGNVSLKTSEGTFDILMQTLCDEYRRNWYSKLVGYLSSPVLKRVKQRLDPRIFNGATLVGLDGIVIKSHGGTDSIGFEHAIHEAWTQAKLGLVSQITSKVNHILHRIEILN